MTVTPVMDNFAAQGMMRTASGWVSLVDPQPSQILLSDVVVPIRRIPRFTGHSDVRLGEHMVRAFMIAQQHLGIVNHKDLRTVLFHDAHEVNIADASTPMKVAMRLVGAELGVKLGQVDPTSAYDTIEHRLMACYAERFNLVYPHPDFVKQADYLALAIEVNMTWGPGEAESWGLPTPIEGFEDIDGGEWERIARWLGVAA